MASDSVSLAIAFHQAPSRFPELLRGKASLPDDVSILLRLAGGALPDAEGLAVPPFSSVEEMQQAALFFIEQVLLARDADHYRVLGVRPDESLEKIKEHHRLLMRLFHPDRDGVLEEKERMAAFATRINLAYTALRQPQAREAYDVTLKQAHQTTSLPMVRWGRTAQSESDGRLLSPAMVRHLPQLVLGGTALLAALGVGMVYLNRPPAGAIGAGDHYNQGQPLLSSATRRPDDLQFEPPKKVASDRPAADSFQERRMASAQTRAASNTPVVMKTPPAEETKTAPVSVADVQASAPKLATPAASLPHELQSMKLDQGMVAPPVSPPAAVSTGSLPQARVVSAETTAAAPTLSPPPQPQSAAAEAPPAVPPDNGQEELAKLMERLAALYEKGDLEAFLALFDENARSEQGGKARIRSDYENLFRNSDARKLYIYDVSWEKDGEIFRGEGSFQAKVVPKGESIARTYNGTIKLEVLKQKKPPSIRGIYHKTS